MRAPRRPRFVQGRKSSILHDWFDQLSRVRMSEDDGRLHEAAKLSIFPDEDACVYCGSKSNLGWDHVDGLVSRQRPSGRIQTPFDMVRCCVPCNSSKGNRSAEEHMDRLCRSNTRAHAERRRRLRIHAAVRSRHALTWDVKRFAGMLRRNAELAESVTRELQLLADCQSVAVHGDRAVTKLLRAEGRRSLERDPEGFARTHMPMLSTRGAVLDA